MLSYKSVFGKGNNMTLFVKRLNLTIMFWGCFRVVKHEASFLSDDYEPLAFWGAFLIHETQSLFFIGGLAAPCVFWVAF
jgi:hypothetical protein